MVEENNNETNDLISFDWGNEGEDFFGSEKETGKETEAEKKKKEEAAAKAEEERIKAKEAAVEEEFFEEGDDDDKESKGSSKETSETGDEYWGDVYKEYKDAGLLKHVEIEEGEELTEDKLSELREEDYEIEMGERLKVWAQKDLDEDAQAFIKFKTTGGTTAEFFQAYSQGADIPEGDITEEAFQDRVIRYQLKTEGWDSDEVEDRLEYLTSSGRKEKIAKKYSVRIEKADAEQKASILEVAKTRKIAQEQQEATYRDSIQDALTSAKEVKGFKITPKDKTDLFTLLTKKDQKISDTKSITGFQKKLGEVFQDPEKMILLAKLVNSDFDMSGFKKAAITKQTTKVKKNLERRRGLRTGSSGGSHQGSSLAELF